MPVEKLTTFSAYYFKHKGKQMYIKMYSLNLP